MEVRLTNSEQVWKSDEGSARSALAGLRVIDLSQNAPGPFASVVLADFGADVIHVGSPHLAAGAFPYVAPVASDPFISTRFTLHDSLMRNKRSIIVDLKSPLGKEVMLRLSEHADVLIEEMRPGKLEKLGLGYADLLIRNPRLIYCSITGYGQTGPRAQEPGHDINYVGLSAALDLLRDRQNLPLPPQNYLADYAGGGLMAVVSILIALQARSKTGNGQHLDISMLDSVTYLSADLLSPGLGARHATDSWRGTLGGSAPFYRVYQCADDKCIAVGALESRFADNLCSALQRMDLRPCFEQRELWPHASEQIATLFKTRTRAQWLSELGTKECCVTPVLEVHELEFEPQSVARELVVEVDGVRQVGVGPKLSSTPGSIRRGPRVLGEDTCDILRALGLSESARKSSVTSRP